MITLSLSLLFSTLTLLTPSSLATVVSVPKPIAGPKSIVFCKEAGFKNCAVPLIFEWGTCWVIPDPNANGDKGSSVKLDSNQTLSTCWLYEGVYCDGKRTKYFQHVLDPIPDDRVYRTFRCELGLDPDAR